MFEEGQDSTSEGSSYELREVDLEVGDTPGVTETLDSLIRESAGRAPEVGGGVKQWLLPAIRQRELDKWAPTWRLKTRLLSWHREGLRLV